MNTKENTCIPVNPAPQLRMPAPDFEGNDLLPNEPWTKFWWNITSHWCASNSRITPMRHSCRLEKRWWCNCSTSNDNWSSRSKFFKQRLRGNRLVFM